MAGRRKDIPLVNLIVTGLQTTTYYISFDTKGGIKGQVSLQETSVVHALSWWLL